MNQSAGAIGPEMEKLGGAADILRARLERFEGDLKKNSEMPNERAMADLIAFLERCSQTSDRTVEIYTDPSLDTYCCAMVPAKKIMPDGKVVEEKDKKTFLIGVPTTHLLGMAPRPFLLGEILHEQGHARWTNFPMMQRLAKLAEQDGYSPNGLLFMLNCVEDPRMERVVGGPLHKPERKLLFDKNSRWILPMLTASLPKLSPPEQFNMLIKTERLWEIYGKDWADIGVDVADKPWKREDLNEDVQRLYADLEPVIKEISGDADLPALRNNEKVEDLVVNKLWPAMKELIDKYPQDPQMGKQSGGRKGGGLKSGAISGNAPEEDEHYDPENPDTWPAALKNLMMKFIEKHEQRLEKEAEDQRKKHELGKIVKAQREDVKNALQRGRDGINSPEAREKYQKFKRELRGEISQLQRALDRYLPRVDDLQNLYGRKGKSFSVQHFVRGYGSGHEAPMISKAVPEEKGLVLQILIDVSGSMNGERIANAIKACLAVCEAAEGRNVAIEILANDEHNLSSDEAYILMGFGEPYSGKVKEHLIQALTEFGGGNEDAAAILAAMPRMEKKMKKVRAEMDRMSGLTVYISDSTTQDPRTSAAAEKARQKFPFEGTAIDNTPEIAQMVKAHFGEASIIPASVKQFPQAFQTILERHIRNLRSQREE